MSINSTISVERITPQLAADFMSRNDANRPISSNIVRQYAAAIARNEWRVNGDSIKFSRAGRLLDGQHRLRAVIVTGIPITSVVVRNLDEEVFTTIDQGKKRTQADILQISGEKNATTLAAAVRVLVSLRKGSRDALRIVTTPEVVEEIERTPNIRHWVSMIRSKKGLKFIPAAAAAVITIGAELHGDDVAERFAVALSTGEMLSNNSPIYILRERLIDAGSSGGLKITSLEVKTAWIIKAWNAYVKGKTIGLLRHKIGDTFPTVE